MEKTRTYLIGRNNLFRQGLRSLLKDSPFEITIESADIAEIEGVSTKNNPPELVVMDLSPDTDSAVERVKEVCRSEEHTSELQSLMRISYAVFCLKKKKTIK